MTYEYRQQGRVMKPVCTITLIAICLTAILLPQPITSADPNPPTTQPLDKQKLLSIFLQGSSTSRIDAMKQILAASHTGFVGIDAAYLPALATCADDPSPQVRSQTAILIGCTWIQSVPTPLPQAVAVEEKLAHDSDAVVRHDAVSAGLKPIKDKSDSVVSALIDSALQPKEYDYRTNVQVIFGLRNVAPDRLLPRLEKFWAGAPADPERAAWAYALYLGATNQDPPNVGRLDKVGSFAVPFRSKGGYSRQEIDAELLKIIPPEISRQWYLSNARGAIFGSVIVQGVADRRQTISDLGTSKMLVAGSTQWCEIVTPDLLAEMRQADAAAATQPAFPGPETYTAAFQQLYDHLGQVYPEFQMKGIDWKSVGDQLLPRSRQVRTQREFGLLVEELVAQLQDSHAAVEAGSAQPPDPDLPHWDPGLLCLIDDQDRPVVFYIEPNSTAQQAGVRIGMTILSVNGAPAQDAMRYSMTSTAQYFGVSSPRVARYYAARQFLYQDQRGAPVRLVLEDPAGNHFTAKISADYDSDRYHPRLPLPLPGIAESADISWIRLPQNIGYIHLHRIRDGLEDSLDAALRDLGSARGLVIDVRGNTGGGFDPDRAFHNFDLSAQNTAEPNRPRYPGPIAVLIDEGCISAGEGWTSWFIPNRRAKLFGATTAGASSAKESYTLSNGLYKVIIPVKPYTGFLDRPIERRGLEPDVAVRANAHDLVEDRDTVLDRAVHWLASSSN